MKTKKQLKDYSWEELLEATSGKEALKEAGRDSGQYTLDNRLGIHTHNKELRIEWAKMGGEANIEQLLQWQKDNDFRVCDLERTDEWKDNIANALKDYYKVNPISDELRMQISNKIRRNNSKLSDKQRSEKFKNDSASRKSLNMRNEILSMIKNNTFTTSEARKACAEYGLGNWKAFLKDERIIKQIHKGTNQNNPSIYQKVK
jgi:hypothetical protein